MTWKKLKPSKELIEYLKSREGRLEGKFKEEEIDTAKIDKYLEAFEKWDEECTPLFQLSSIYNNIKKFTNDVNFTSELTQEEIQEIIKKIEDFPKKNKNPKCFKYAGIFISYLINECYPGKEIEIEVSYPFGYLGLNNEKTLIIYGDVGDYVGDRIVDGEIIVNGNAGDWVGISGKGGKITIKGNAGDWVGISGKGGKITIKGNAGDFVGKGKEGGKIVIGGNTRDFVGKEMVDGEIIVNGNAGDYLGAGMNGGTIYIFGGYNSIGDFTKGKIYYKRKLIYENGKRVE